MAYVVFGKPITDSTLRELPGYHQADTISPIDRAREALKQKNALNKEGNARTFIGKFKQQFGADVSTKCLVYNATGSTLTFVTHHNWHGGIVPTPHPVPIENGQWGVFLHVNVTSEDKGSVGAVVYHGQNNAGANCDWMLSWFNPRQTSSFDNRVFTEVHEAGAAGHYGESYNWDRISDILYKSDETVSTKIWNGCSSELKTDQGTTVPVVEATLTILENANA